MERSVQGICSVDGQESNCHQQARIYSFFELSHQTFLSLSNLFTFECLSAGAMEFFTDATATALKNVSIISLVPIALLYFIPPLSSDTLDLMKAFAAGGLLGDVFLHALPEAIEHGSGGDAMRLSAWFLGGFVFSLTVSVSFVENSPWLALATSLFQAVTIS